MKTTRMCGLVFLAGNLLVSSLWAQSIADVARKEREKKQQQSKTNSTRKVYSNDNIASGGASQPAASPTPAGSPVQNSNPATEKPKGKQSAAEWEQKIRQQKQAVNLLQDQINQLQSSIHYVEANAYTNGVQYNEAQHKKQEDVDRLQQRLTEEKKKLEDLQEGARKDGYGNTVYDPS